MLKGMRRSAKHILWPLIIALVITMGGYGVWYLVRPGGGSSQIGAIWGRPVRMDEFIQAARTARAVAALGGRDPERKELYMMTWRRLLLQREAERMGVATSRRDLAHFLAQWPIFQIDGRFHPDRYTRVLAGLGMDANTFETQIESLLANDRMGMIIRSQALVSPAEAEWTQQRINEEIRVEYGRVGFEESSLLREIPEAELREYFQQNRAEFHIQTEIAIDYLLVETTEFTAPDGTEETGPDQAPANAVDRANAISRMLDYEDSLAKPAEEYGLEIRESGYFSPEKEIPGVGMVPEIQRLVPTMKTGAIAGYPLQVPDGFLIFQLTGIKPAREPEFEEVQKDIREILLAETRREEALESAREKLLKIRRLMTEEERDFAGAAEGVELEIKTTDFFTRQGSDNLPSAPQFATAAFLTLPDQVSDLIPGEDGFFFLSVLERKPAPPMPEDEREKWLEIARQSRSEILYEAWFNDLVRRSGFSITNKEFTP